MTTLIPKFQRTGTTVNRPFNDKLLEVVSIADFIPIGTNTATTDCSAYIQAALDSKASNLIVYGGGLTYKCTSNIVIKGGYKTLDLENGTLDFYSAVAIYGVTIRTTILDPMTQEFRNSLINAHIEMANATAVNGNIGVYQQGKSLNNLVDNVTISNVNGYGYFVNGGVDSTSQFNSPDKGTHTNITCTDCDVGFQFESHNANDLMSGHVLSGLYAPTCGTAYYIIGCAEFSMSGLNAESYTSYGLRLDDLSIGGGHVLAGGFFEGAGTSFDYANPNPSNANTILAKGSSGVSTLANWYASPATTVGFGSGLVIKQSGSRNVDLNTNTPFIVSTDAFANTLTIMGRGGQYARFLLGTSTGSITLATAGSFVVNTYYTIQSVGTTDFTLIGAASNAIGVIFKATGVGVGTGTAISGFVEVLEKGLIVDVWGTTKGTATKCNVYIGTEGGISGFYVQNLAALGSGSGLVNGTLRLEVQG